MSPAAGVTVVIGAGVAGVAAAWSARRQGREVTVVSAGVGASALAGGAVDDLPWERLARAAAELALEPRATELPAETLAFAADLGLWSLPEASVCYLATLAGCVRPARGADRALLDLGALRDVRVLVPRAGRPGWDADALAAGLEAEPFARARGLRFEAVDVPVLRYDEEHRVADGDLAARHDAAARLAWLAARLREGCARHGGNAVLLGPWLGATAPRAAALSAEVGFPVGEALAGAGSPAGLRFEAARRRLFTARGIGELRARVLRLDRAEGELRVYLAGGAAPLAASAVVLAVGGLAGGGLAYVPPDHDAGDDLPPSVAPAFRCSVDLDGLLDDRGRDLTSSMSGPVLDLCAWPEGARAGDLETAGLRCEGERLADGVTVAGDLLAFRRRTVLEAVASGLRAAR